MTVAKRNRGRSEKRPYSHSGNGHRTGPRTLPADEILRLFQLIGWIGPVRGR